MSPLNQALYEGLQREFGHVRVFDDGAGMEAVYHPGPDGRLRLQVISAGEYLVVNCPFCNDTRFRLWINHRWGLRDVRTGTRNRWLAICYNEDCLRDEANRVALIRRLSWYHRGASAGRVEIRKGRLDAAGKRVALPRDFVLLDQLEDDHPAREYVRGRGFDPDKLCRVWRIGFSKQAFCLTPHGRLLIPIFKAQEGKFVCWGWQARAIHPGDEAQWPKYFNARNLRKSCLLYGLDEVREGNGPVLVCEGPTDVWRAGKNAVALFGKHASEHQIRLIRKHLRGRPLVVALDPDAREDAVKLTRKLRAARADSLLSPDTAPVARAVLPEGCDPGDCDRQELWELAGRALRRRGAAGEESR